MICRQSRSSWTDILAEDSFATSFLLSRRIKILAFSKVDLLAIFKNCLNSLLELEPEPSAMLLDIDIPADLSCSAKRYNLFCSRLSAISKSWSAISIASCQILRSWNRNFTMVPHLPLTVTYCPTLYALCSMPLFCRPISFFSSRFSF